MSSDPDKKIFSSGLGHEVGFPEHVMALQHFLQASTACLGCEHVLSDGIYVPSSFFACGGCGGALIVNVSHKVTVLVHIGCPASSHTLLRDGEGGGLKNVLFPSPHTKPVWIEQIGWSRSRKGSGSTSFRCSWVSSDPLVRWHRYVRHAERASCIVGRGMSCCEEQEEEEEEKQKAGRRHG